MKPKFLKTNNMDILITVWEMDPDSGKLRAEIKKNRMFSNIS